MLCQDSFQSFCQDSFQFFRRRNVRSLSCKRSVPTAMCRRSTLTPAELRRMTVLAAWLCFRIEGTGGSQMRRGWMLTVLILGCV